MHFTPHLLENRRPKNCKKLHDKMMFIADTVVRHNWTDVAIHDRNKLANIPVGHHCAWVIHELGSYLSPLYCRLDQRDRWEADPNAPIQTLMIRWIASDNPLMKCSHHAGLSPVSGQFYLVVKTDEFGGGSIIESSFQEFYDLALYFLNQTASAQ